MTPETKLIWDKINEVQRATVSEMVAWTCRPHHLSGVTISLMIQAGQLKFLGRRKSDGKAVYGVGLEHTFGGWNVSTSR